MRGLHIAAVAVAMYCAPHRTYTLKRGAVGASGTATTSHEGPLLPLWGQICCKLMVQPDCASDSRITGFINVHVSLFVFSYSLDDLLNRTCSVWCQVCLTGCGCGVLSDRTTCAVGTTQKTLAERCPPIPLSCPK